MGNSSMKNYILNSRETQNVTSLLGEQVTGDKALLLLLHWGYVQLLELNWESSALFLAVPKPTTGTA